MEHICDENGCRLVSKQEYEKYLSSKKEQEAKTKGEQKTQKRVKKDENSHKF